MPAASSQESKECSFISLRSEIVLTLRKVTLKSKTAVLLFEILKHFLFYYLLLWHRYYHRCFHTFFKASDRVSIAGLVVTSGFTNQKLVIQSHLGQLIVIRNKINQ